MEFHGIFHGIPCNPNVIWNGVPQVPWNSMELGDIWFGDIIVPWNPMKYSMQFHGNGAPSSMGFHGTWWHLLGGGWVPWNLMEYSMTFHGTWAIWTGATLVPWSSMKLLQYSKWRLHNSMDVYIKLLGSPVTLDVILISNHQVPWNSMRLG